MRDLDALMRGHDLELGRDADTGGSTIPRCRRTMPRLPEVIHGHYADACHVGVQRSRLLGIPRVIPPGTDTYRFAPPGRAPISCCSARTIRHNGSAFRTPYCRGWRHATPGSCMPNV